MKTSTHIELLSPNGKYQGVIFTDGGGHATVDFS